MFLVKPRPVVTSMVGDGCYLSPRTGATTGRGVVSLGRRGMMDATTGRGVVSLGRRGMMDATTGRGFTEVVRWRGAFVVLLWVFCYFALLVITNGLFIPTSADLRPFWSEFCLVGGVAGNLLIPFAVRRPNSSCAVATLLTLIAAALCLLLGHRTSLFGTHLAGMLLYDPPARLWKITLLFFVAGTVALWMGHSGRTIKEGDAPEFFVLLLGATLGMCLMASTTNLLMIFLAIALASMPSYLLAGFKKGSRRGAEASLKYVLFGAVTSGIMIYGISFLYGVYGTLDLNQLSHPAMQGARASAAVWLGLLGLLVGIGFKISAVPFHFWCPDVFEGASIEVTTFLSVASKGAALILLLRVVTAIEAQPVNIIVGVIGMLTATVGNLAAFPQMNIKRLLAYSSIAQAGYMVCLISATGSTNNPVNEAVGQALLLYLVIYAVMNLGAFAVASVVIRRSCEQLEHFAGLGRLSPVLAGSLLCCLVSLIGLPPFAGFLAKVNILWVLARGGRFGNWLVAVIVLNTVLSAFYYFRVIKVMYLEPATDKSRMIKIWARDPVGVVIGACCGAGLVLLFFGFGKL